MNCSSRNVSILVKSGKLHRKIRPGTIHQSLSCFSACLMSKRAWELFERSKFNIPSLSIDDIRFVPNEDFLGPIYGSSV